MMKNKHLKSKYTSRSISFPIYWITFNASRVQKENSNNFIFKFLGFQSVSAYNATLGHKINHSPDPNVDYGFIDHPRFGKIR